MHIQNLYYSNRFIEAKQELSKLNNNMSDALLLYTIKIHMKLNNIKKAQLAIDTFLNKFSESDFLSHVMYEKKLLERKHD